MFNLPATKYPTTQRTVSGTILVYPDDVVLNCDTSSGAVVIQLAEIPDDYFSTQYKLYVVDISNNASVNNITIVAGIGQTINGAASIQITTNKGSIEILISGNTSYIGLQSNAVSTPTGFIPVTYVQLSNLISTNTILPNGDYLLLDAQFGSLPVIPTNVYLKGMTLNKVSLDGQGIFFNADYQGVGVYTGITGFVGQLGLWNLTLTPVINNVCIWNNTQFLNITGVNGLTNPTLDAVNWQPLARQVNYGYIVEVDVVYYNATNNNITYRLDKRGNQVEVVVRRSRNSLNCFKWGDDRVTQNSVFNRSILDNANLTVGGFIFTNAFIGNVLENSVVLFGTATVNGSVYEFANNIINGSDVIIPVECYQCSNNRFFNSNTDLYFTTVGGTFSQNLVDGCNNFQVDSTNQVISNEFTNTIFLINSNTNFILNNVFSDSSFEVTILTSGIIQSNRISSSNITVTTNTGTILLNVFQNVTCPLMLNNGNIERNILSNIISFEMNSNGATAIYSDNIIENVTTAGILNQNDGFVRNNTVFNSTNFWINDNTATGTVDNNSLNNDCIFAITLNEASIFNNTLYAGSTMTVGKNTGFIVNGTITNKSTLTISDNDGLIGTNPRLKGFKIENQSIITLTAILSTGVLAAVSLDNDSSCIISTLACDCTSISLFNSSIRLNNTTVTTSGLQFLTFANVQLGSPTYNLTEQLTGTSMSGNSTFKATLDCSDPLVYNPATFTLTIPTGIRYAGGQYLLNNAAGIKIQKIINLSPSWSTRFIPTSGSITFESIAVGLSVPFNIVSRSGTFNFIVTYRVNGCDYIELTNVGGLCEVSNTVILT